MVCKKKFAPLEYLFHYYNQELFHGELYDCLMNRKVEFRDTTKG